jgi:hypothetical protein
MRIFAILRLTVIVMAMAGALCPVGAAAQEASQCEGIASDLSAAIARDRAKTLMLLEDALVINESCASEIVTAALQAHAGDAEMQQQIVDTSINVAPKMAAVIRAAAGIATPETATVAAAVQPPNIEGRLTSGEGDGASDEDEDLNPGYASFGSGNIRGIYLVQPPPSGLPSSDLLRKFCHVATSPCTCTP